MEDFLTSMWTAFASFVQMLFELPFYGGISYGHLILAIYIAALVFGFLIGRVK